MTGGSCVLAKTHHQVNLEEADWPACDTRDQGRIFYGKMLFLGPSKASPQLAIKGSFHSRIQLLGVVIN